MFLSLALVLLVKVSNVILQEVLFQESGFIPLHIITIILLVFAKAFANLKHEQHYTPLPRKRLKYSSMRPRTFYLSPNQEFQVISQVLCEGMPCPEFSVVQDHPNFIQQRSYRSSKFLKLTAPRLCSLKSVLEDGIDRAEKYIKGANNREQMYVHTQPLLIEVDQHTSSKSKNPWCRMSYSANLFIPHFWGIIATPTKILAEFQEIPENSQIYVHTFEGNIEKVLLTEIELFRRNLDSFRLCYKKMKFYVAIYDIPHSPSDSRNELWFLKCSGR